LSLTGRGRCRCKSNDKREYNLLNLAVQQLNKSGKRITLSTIAREDELECSATLFSESET
jgi:hypothetical protein